MKPYYQDSAVTIYHGDCREIVPLLGRFDLLLTDPPYGISVLSQLQFTKAGIDQHSWPAHCGSNPKGGVSEG